MKKILKISMLTILALIALVIVLTAIINIYMIKSTEDQVLTPDNVGKSSPDCIIVLGAMVYNDGTPSPILKERLDTGIALYKAGVSDKLLMSGDNGQKEYNEVIPMRQYAISNGVSPEDIYLDYAGFSTYESMYRLSEIFQVEKAIVVTQRYHLYRALYIGNSLDIEVTGVSATDRVSGQTGRDIREMFARVKSFWLIITDANPTYLGDTISLDTPQEITD